MTVVEAPVIAQKNVAEAVETPVIAQKNVTETQNTASKVNVTTTSAIAQANVTKAAVKTETKNQSSFNNQKKKAEKHVEETVNGEDKAPEEEDALKPVKIAATPVVASQASVIKTQDQKKEDDENAITTHQTIQNDQIVAQKSSSS